jgi:hypothetical protein
MKKKTKIRIQKFIKLAKKRLVRVFYNGQRGMSPVDLGHRQQ